MPIPSTIESLSTTAASNGPAGSEQRTLADDGLRQAYAFIRQLVTLGSNIASASSITPPSTGSSFNITGTTSITAIASTNSWDGRVIRLIFAGALTLTHSSNLALPGSVNITTAANDIAEFVQTASGAWRCATYQKAGSGALLAGNVVIPAPSSGIALTITGLSGSSAAHIVAPSGTLERSVFGGVLAGTNNPRVEFYHTESTGLSKIDFASSTGTRAGEFSIGATTFMSVTSNRNVTIAAPSSGDTATFEGLTSANSNILLATSANIGFANSLSLVNSDNTNTGSNSVVNVQVGGASGGDAVVQYTISGGQQWRAGIDNSDSDKYKISASAALGTNDTLSITTVGNVTIAAPSSGVGFTGTGFAGSDAFVYNGGTSGSFRVNTTGVPYGTSLHNNAGAVTGTTNQYITSGTYTPTLTNGVNITAETQALAQWMRVGNVVTVSGGMQLDPTAAATLTTFNLSLPIASNLTSSLGGSLDGTMTLVDTASVQVGAVGADTGGDTAAFYVYSGAGAANGLLRYTYTYLIQ